VYNLEEQKKEPVGGAARFITAVNKYKDDDPLVLFSGDIFSPSQLSTVLKGKQMVPIYEHLKVHVNVVGNHDLDFGKEAFIKLRDKTNSPWLCTNIFEYGTTDPLCGCLDHYIMDHKGVKIGFLGLAEDEWLDSIITLNEDDYEYEDFVKSAKKWVKILKEKD
jgi:5'-nucleotidase